MSKGRLRASVCALLSAGLLAPAPQAGAQVQQILPAGVRLELPFVVNGFYLGDITVLSDAQGELLVERSRLIELLSRRLTAEKAAALAESLPESDFVMAGIVKPFAKVTLDSSRIEITATVPISQLRTREVSFTGNDEPENFDPLAAADMAAALGVNLGANYIHEGGDPGLSPLAGRLYGFLNFGGVEGFSLDFEAIYEEDAEPSFRRGDITLFRDFPERATRLSLGDVLVTGNGFQGLPRLGGVAYQRLYAELDPLRSVRPTGRTTFVLETGATVDVVVNGNRIRTIRFAAGAYDLRDIPFAEGANQVELIIRQDDGVVRTLTFDAFSSSTLLSEGLSEFGFAAGLPSRIVTDGLEYDDDLFTASGFYRIGISDRLTLGASAQANPHIAQFGLEAVSGFSDLLFSGDLAVSTQGENEFGPAAGTDFAGELNLRYRPSWAENRDFSADLNVVYTGRDFADISSFGTINPYEWEYAARTSFALPAEIRTSLSAGFRRAREGFEDVGRYTAAFSRRIGPISATASYEYTEIDDEDDHRLLISLVWTPRGGDVLARGSYDSLDERYRAELSYIPGFGVGSLSGTIAAESSENGDRLSGTARYFGNRFTGTASHTAVYESLGSDLSSQLTSLSVQSGLAFADGRFGVGQVGQGSFAIIDAGPAVEGARILVDPSDEGARARTDFLGPAVVTALRGFAPARISAVVDSDSLDLLGNDRVESLLPGSRTGHRITVGETVTVTVLGRAINQDGEPIGLKVGRAEAMSGDLEAIDTFTNSTGRFVVEDLPPGRYTVSIPGEGHAILVIPDDARGFVEVGTIRFSRETS